MRALLFSEEKIELFTKFGGGKARNMARMTQFGISVPEWFCVSSIAFQDFLKEHEIVFTIDRNLSFLEWSKIIEEKIISKPLNEKLRREITQALQKLSLLDEFVAVRSSGLDEDSAENSFAGMFSSYLFQKGIDAIELSIKRCWASAFSERALEYRVKRGLTLNNIELGVVIQKMVNARVAGVAFSRNPIQATDRDHMIVDSVYGLGEGLVSGELDADHYLVHRSTFEVQKTIAEKEYALVRGESGGLQKIEVTASESRVSSLKEPEIREIAKLALKLEEFTKNSQDIEWAIENTKLYCVQMRPITTLPPEIFFDESIKGTEPTLWDNSNIIESYSGVTSPLTFSYASNAYRGVYLQFSRMLLVPEEVLTKNAHQFRNMLGLVRGRIYYNLGHWYGLLMLLPGASTNKSFMETMMGVKQSLKPEFQKIFDFMSHPTRFSVSAKLKLYYKILWMYRNRKKVVSEFKKHFNSVYFSAKATNFRSMSLHDQVKYYYHLEDQLMDRWQAPIMNDFLAMIFFGTLKKLTANWIASGNDGESLQNDLLCGQGDLESTEPTKALMRIAEKIDHSHFREKFLATSSTEIWVAMHDQGQFPEIYKMFQEFLDRFGFRCVNELKLEELDLNDDPSFVVGAVVGYVRMKSYSISAMQERETKIRNESEGKVKEKISGIKRKVFFWVLDRARWAVKTREDLRFDRTKIYGILRRLFRGMGLNLQKLGVLNSEHDVFYLTLDELIAYGEGRSVNLNFREIVEARRREFDEYRNTSSPPDRFLTYGSAGVTFPYLQVLLDSDLLVSETPKSDDPNVLIGTACCPGVVEGEVRVAHSLKDAEGLSGEILVTSRTDPGWVPLYPSCSGLLIERGSLLSHSAVVARELGLPTIVGISGGLMKRLKTGMKVRVDAAKGEVRILDD